MDYLPGIRRGLLSAAISIMAAYAVSLVIPAGDLTWALIAVGFSGLFSGFFSSYYSGEE